MPKGQYDRNLMKLAGTETALVDGDYKKQFYQPSRRGRKAGSLTFDQIYKGELPRTPFEKLQFDLKLTKTEFAEAIQMTMAAVSAVCRGSVSATVPVAKRMQEEARKRGIAITLDELYQHVIPWALDDPLPSRKTSSPEREDSLL